ncbi:uncharacterized protein LOC110235620 [Exaiptasia diaphana]|uniref:SWIM-type domain-containing protein n=1 Tax=Exaiptasia diaphana TaxID=2652724 RepID=A0A913WZY7_EXADI|nr:uncharacterized protein LOC110235620 [Exaiptasia diaphana]
MLCAKFKMAEKSVPFVGKTEIGKEKVKKKITEKDINVQFLLSIGQKTTGTNEEIKERADLFRNQPKLTEFLEKEVKARKQTSNIFGRELDGSKIPLPQEPWKIGPFPTFTAKQLDQYAQSKLPGRKSMLEKGERFFNSRKIVTMRVLRKNDETWVRAWVKQSYGEVQRPAFVKFNKIGCAVGGSCTCTVGVSGLCAHVISVLYQLIHHTQTGTTKNL